MSREEVVETAKDFIEISFPTYEIVKTDHIGINDIDTVPHQVHLTLEDGMGQREKAEIEIEEVDGEFNVADIFKFVPDEPDQPDPEPETESVDNPAVKARQFFSSSYPTYEIVKTDHVGLTGDSVPHRVHLIVEDETGERERAEMEIEERDDGFEVTDIFKYAPDDAE